MKSEIEVPDEWELVELSDVAEINKGLSYKSKDYGTRNDGIIFINLKCILKGGGFNRRGIKYYKGDYKNEHLVKSGDIIIANTDLTRNGDIVGAPIFVPNLNGKTCISMDLSSLTFLGEIIDKKYGYYYLCQENIREFMRRNSSGSTVLHLNLQAVKKLKFLLPPMEEQQKIVDILSKVDGQIDFTERIIDKTEELEKGLMRKLLTNGIGHTKFRKTELGEIPEEWEVVKIGLLLDDMYSGGTPSTKKENYWNGDIPWMTSVNINSDIEISKGQKNISIDGVENSSTKIVPKDNILFVTRVGLGKVAINKIDIAINQDITGLIVNKNKTDLKYLFWQLSLISQKIQKKSQGTTIKGILKKDLFNTKVAIFNMQEQIKIGSILSKVDEQIQDNKKELNHLKELKKGLMQDLLTGKVRVTI